MLDTLTSGDESTVTEQVSVCEPTAHVTVALPAAYPKIVTVVPLAVVL